MEQKSKFAFPIDCNLVIEIAVVLGCSVQKMLADVYGYRSRVHRVWLPW